MCTRSTHFSGLPRFSLVNLERRLLSTQGGLWFCDTAFKPVTISYFLDNLRRYQDWLTVSSEKINALRGLCPACGGALEIDRTGGHHYNGHV